MNVVLACGQVNRKWSVVRKARGQVVGQGRCRVRVHPQERFIPPTRWWSRLDRDADRIGSSGFCAKRRTIVAGARFIYVCTRNSFDKILDSFCRPRKSTNFYFSNRNSSIRSSCIQSNAIEVQLTYEYRRVIFSYIYIISAKLSLGTK